MDPERRLQIRTGAFVLLVLVVLGIVVASLREEGGLFARRYQLYAEFNNIEGLFVNSPVLLAGNQVGRVRDIQFLSPGSEYALRVELDIDRAVQERICADSLATVRQQGLLGDMYVDITQGGTGSPVLPEGGRVPTREPFSINELADQAQMLFANLVSLSSSAERLVGTFEQEMGTESVASTLGSLSRIAGEIESGSGALHALIFEDFATTEQDIRTSVADFRTSLERLNALLAEVEHGDGLLHDFIYGTEETDMSTLAAIKASAERLENVLRKIDEGEGSLGALVNDPTVYEDIKMIVGGARESALLRGLIGFMRSDGGPSE